MCTKKYKIMITYQSKEELNKDIVKHIPNDIVMRRFIANIVNNIPLSDLKILFNIEILDPESPKFIEAMYHEDTKDIDRGIMLDLLERNVVLIKSSVTI